MGGRDGRRLSAWAVVAAAIALAGAGGSAVGLGAPAWLAGAVAAVSALVAGTVVDRVFHVRDERAAAAQRRSAVLAALTPAVPAGPDDALGLLRADQSPVPYRGRRRELERLAEWCADDAACPVFMIGGPAGVGKSRLALEFASRRLPGIWQAGWLRAGTNGNEAVSAVRACGDPTVILVDDADARSDLAPLLDTLAEQYTSPPARVIMMARSAAGLAASLALQVEDRHDWIIARAAKLELQPDGGPEDQARWFGEAVTAFAADRGVPVPALPDTFRAGRRYVSQPVLMLQAQALLAVLGGPTAGSDPRQLSSGEVAEALMRHEKRRWRATAAGWSWGSGGPLSETLQERSITALVLLGAASEGEAAQVVGKVPELRDATAERLSAITAWVSAFYPPDADGIFRLRPDLIGEWFIVTQLTAHPELARNLRDSLTDAQAARALAFLARAADRIEPASRLFDDFASGNLSRRVLAAAQAAVTGEAGRQLLDTVVAAQIRSGAGWTIDHLAEISHLIPEHVLLITHVAIADLTVTLYRPLAAGNPAAHQADLARALGNLGVLLDRVSRYQDALAARTESVNVYRVLASRDPDLYQDQYRQTLSALRREYEQRGMHMDAILHHLADSPDQPPSPPLS